MFFGSGAGKPLDVNRQQNRRNGRAKADNNSFCITPEMQKAE
jgi:hypothetical protein